MIPILEIVESQQNMASNPELCNDVRSIANRLRVSLSERLGALEDLLGFMKNMKMNNRVSVLNLAPIFLNAMHYYIILDICLTLSDYM